MFGAVLLKTRGRRLTLVSVLVAITLVIALSSPHGRVIRNSFGKHAEHVRPSEPVEPMKKQPKYLAEPEWSPPPIKDPFPSLTTSPPPPIPAWNIPRKDLHKEYGLSYAPPLFIGFTRGWPLLLQTVASYITAGWPAEQIYVVENTGTQRANLDGRLSLQNPFYLDHNVLKKKLHVNVIRTPVLLNFAQLQNFYLHLAHEHDWPQYFWSHMDVVALSWEDGHEGRPRPGDEGYKTLYENALAELNTTLLSHDRWATRFFAYDAFTLVNRAAYDDVGGWDTYIPYYITDCDMHSRLLMHNWTLGDRAAGIIADVSTALTDLRVLYRDPSAVMGFTDPNPAAPDEKGDKPDKVKGADEDAPAPAIAKRDEQSPVPTERLLYWQKLRETVSQMEAYKHGSRGRNTWQAGQRGGQGEPYYYPARGVQTAFEMLTDAGRRIYAEKWGHQNCDLLGEGGLKLADQWRVSHDWE
ncbi:hypothetical protein E4U42_001186 [Claviceps africana]|uniref:Glycosyl transferase family 8 protein n=1 Tax=Claviceps africana TaxID=83212 RepID=A0A8K0NFA5_9HYPO|nr:hypothetical protein E4U42_001186 [Claviceps africana]